jgi:hypothetical protein
MGILGRAGRRMKAVMMRRLPGMITCAEFERFVVDHYEGTLTVAERRVFERHLALCPPCRVDWEAYCKAIALSQRLFTADDADDPAPVDDALVAAVLAARDGAREG